MRFVNLSIIRERLGKLVVKWLKMFEKHFQPFYMPGMDAGIL